MSLLDPSSSTRAAGYTLGALAEEAEAGTVLELCRDVVSRGFDGEEFRQSASYAISRLVERKATIDDDVVAILEGWLLRPLADPSTSEEQATLDDAVFPDGKSRAGVEGVIHSSLVWGYGGFSALPGDDYPVMQALARVLFARGESERLERALTIRLDRGKDLPVWEAMLPLLLHLHPGDVRRRIAFIDRLFREVPALVATKAAAQMLGRAHWWDDAFVERHLAPWAVSDKSEFKQGYGELVALVALQQPSLDWAGRRLAAITTSEGADFARAGSALTAAHLFAEPDRRREAAALLVILLRSGEARVWEACFEVFRIVEELTPDNPTRSLLSAFADRLHEAPAVDPTFVGDQLATLLPHEAGLIARFVEGLIGRLQSELGDMRTAAASLAPQMVDLAVSLHRLGPETREAGIGIFERLLDIDVWGARQTLDEIDHRMRDEPARPPARLSRRRTTTKRRVERTE